MGSEGNYTGWKTYGNFTVTNALSAGSISTTGALTATDVNVTGNIIAGGFSTGNMTASNITTANITALSIKVTDSNATGYVTLNSGGGNQPGYCAFFKPDTVRVGYVGWSNDGYNLTLAVENGYTGWSTNGNFTALKFNTTSDYRIKDNVQNLDATVYNTDKLRPVSYLNTVSNKQSMGLIAHELQEEYPFLVDGEKDGATNQSVDYIGLIAILIKEIQDLKAILKKNKIE